MNYYNPNNPFPGGPLPVGHNSYNQPMNPTVPSTGPAYNTGASVPSYTYGGYTVPAANLMKSW